LKDWNYFTPLRRSSKGYSTEQQTKGVCPELQTPDSGSNKTKEFILICKLRTVWVVSALIEMDKKLRKVSGFRQLHQLADTVGKQILIEPKNFN
jgi:hypothetical protein